MCFSFPSFVVPKMMFWKHFFWCAEPMQIHTNRKRVSVVGSCVWVCVCVSVWALSIRRFFIFCAQFGDQPSEIRLKIIVFQWLYFSSIKNLKCCYLILLWVTNTIEGIEQRDCHLKSMMLNRKDLNRWRRTLIELHSGMIRLFISVPLFHSS